jgi:hypothetical protein
MDDKTATDPTESDCQTNSSSESVGSGDHKSLVSDESAELGRMKKDALSGAMKKSPSGNSLTGLREDSSGGMLSFSKSSMLNNGLFQRQPSQQLEYQLICDPDTQSVRDAEARDSVYHVERRNLVNLLKLVNKTLIESCINSNRTIDYDQNRVLHHFFNVLEQIFKHALKSKYDRLMELRNSILIRFGQILQTKRDYCLVAKKFGRCLKCWKHFCPVHEI